MRAAVWIVQEATKVEILGAIALRSPTARLPPPLTPLKKKSRKNEIEAIFSRGKRRSLRKNSVKLGRSALLRMRYLSSERARNVKRMRMK